jgi:two-component system cell cycle response regulator
MEPKILIVDDDRTMRLIVMAALHPFACQILEADNGLQGLELAKRELPNLILLDRDMPVMDGMEMLASLKGNRELHPIPVIMLTAESARSNVLNIVKLGVRGYLIKPVKPEVLLEHVSQVIELRTRSQIAPETRHSDDGLQILVVDDKPAILEQVKAGLAGTACTVIGARDASQAMDSCDRTLPHIILISLSLPADSAFTLFQWLRADVRTQGAPILALSVKTTAEEQARAKELGFSGIITLFPPTDSSSMT